MRRMVCGTALLAAGCSGGGGGGAGNGDIAGIWQKASGPMLSRTASQVPVTLDFLQLSKDGTGVAYGTRASGVHGCGPLLFTVINGYTVAMDTPGIEGDRLYRWSHPDSNTLELVDEAGAVTTFNHATSVPAADLCTDAAVSASFDLSVTIAEPSGLAYDGAALYYRAAIGQSMTAVSITNASSVGTYPFSTQWSQPMSFDVDSFWTHCWHCNHDTIERRNQTDQLLASFSLSDVAVDSAEMGGIARRGDGKLYISSVQGYPDQVYKLLQVTTNPAKSLDATSVTDTFYDALATDAAGNLWGLADLYGPVLVRIDPATGQALKVEALPREVRWTSIAFANDKLFLSGASAIDPSKPGVLARIDTP